MHDTWFATPGKRLFNTQMVMTHRLRTTGVECSGNIFFCKKMYLQEILI